MEAGFHWFHIVSERPKQTPRKFRRCAWRQQHPEELQKKCSSKKRNVATSTWLQILLYWRQEQYCIIAANAPLLMSAFWHCCKLSCSDCKKNISTLLQIHFYRWQEQNHGIRAGAFFKGPQRLSHSILLQITLYWWQEHQDAADCFVLMGRIIWWLLQIHLHGWQEQMVLQIVL